MTTKHTMKDLDIHEIKATLKSITFRPCIVNELSDKGQEHLIKALDTNRALFNDFYFYLVDNELITRYVSDSKIDFKTIHDINHLYKDIKSDMFINDSISKIIDYSNDKILFRLFERWLDYSSYLSSEVYLYIHKG